MTEENNSVPTTNSIYNVTTTTGINGITYRYFCAACSRQVGSDHICPNQAFWGGYWWDWRPPGPRCQFCDAINHTTVEKCSRVKAIKYHESGKVAQITFHKD